MIVISSQKSYCWAQLVPGTQIPSELILLISTQLSLSALLLGSWSRDRCWEGWPHFHLSRNPRERRVCVTVIQANNPEPSPVNWTWVRCRDLDSHLLQTVEVHLFIPNSELTTKIIERSRRTRALGHNQEPQQSRLSHPLML